MSSDAKPAIVCRGLGKAYPLASHPAARLRHLLFRTDRGPQHWALREVDLSVQRGDVLGIVGTNGAGKSTLLQLLCGTLTPTEGTVEVSGRIAALLELGAGFNPALTGRDNAQLNAVLLGLSPAEVEERLPSIIEFADIGPFIDQPVKTYSSGMFVRLAFAVATSVEPDVLIVDEALSVGDGAFARKSFDRIMQLRQKGATILFCSHSMYQIEALCERAVWLDGGRVRAHGAASEVCSAYQVHLNGIAGVASQGMDHAPASLQRAPKGSGRITGLTVSSNHQSGAEVEIWSEQDDLKITIDFVCDPDLPCPSVALGISDQNGLTVSSVLSLTDGVMPQRASDGIGRATVILQKVPLLKGRYSITPFLLSEDGLHPYDQVIHAGHFNVRQSNPLQGIVTLPRRWE